LSNKNESATVPETKKFSELNKALIDRYTILILNLKGVMAWGMYFVPVWRAEMVDVCAYVW